jgi:hypothetical protein
MGSGEGGTILSDAEVFGNGTVELAANGRVSCLWLPKQKRDVVHQIAENFCER